MRILLITNLYPPYGRGGAEIVVSQEARELRDAGHEVFVLTTKPWSGFSSLAPKESMEDDIHVFRFFPLNLYWYRHDFKHSTPVRLIWHIIDVINPEAWFVARRLIKKIQPDEIHTHNMQGIGMLMLHAVRTRAHSRFGTPYPWMHFLHDVQLITPSGLFFYNDEQAFTHTGFPTRVYRAFCRALVGSPRVVRAPSEWVWNMHRAYQFFPKSVFEKISWSTPEDILTAWRSARPLRFLFVGQMAEHKGVLFLLDVLRELPNGSCTVHMVGNGPLFPLVQDHARVVSWIVAHGRLSLQRVKELLRDTDCLLFPSLAHENSPTIIAEALRQHIPVLASRVGGVPEMIQDGVNGWLVSAGNAAEWKRVILKITQV